MVMFFEFRKFFTNGVLIIGKIYSHDLISLRRDRSEFFCLYRSEIFFTEKFHRKRRVTIDLVLDILSQFGLVKILHRQQTDKTIS